MKRIILASSSPRRKILLKKTGLSFKIVKSNFEEIMDDSLPPSILAKKLALGKALTVAQKFKNALIIGADTFIVCNGKIMGKAHTKEEAKKMLGKLSGRVHLVITGLAVVDSQTRKKITITEKSRVYFKKLTEKEIDEYIKTGEPLEKAGAYAIQGLGAKLIEKYEGDYDNIVGLPVRKLLGILRKFGF